MVNVKDVQLGTTTRKSFAKINEVMQMPNLIEVQKKSYQWFLDEGLKEVFRDIGSITDNSEKLTVWMMNLSTALPNVRREIPHIQRLSRCRLASETQKQVKLRTALFIAAIFLL